MKTFATEVDAAIAAARAAKRVHVVARPRARGARTRRASLAPRCRPTKPPRMCARHTAAPARSTCLPCRCLHEVAQRRAPRASYRAAIEWIAGNDDTSWLEHDANVAEGTECIAAALVADVWGKTTEQVRADLQRAVERMTKGQA